MRIFISIEVTGGTVRHGYANIVYNEVLVGTGMKKCSSFNHQGESFDTKLSVDDSGLGIVNFLMHLC